ncbi:beta strand repeat-containing protein [Rhodobacter capsulatus]|uniref:beta strand repeat-containing protein n=1 Tax=Rhodobacter capsulatus TaxID=1061 RepID=UPI0040288851
MVTALAGSSYAAGTVLTGTDLFSASDPQGSSDIDYIRVFDASLTGGAVWRYNGSVVTPGSAGFQFEYANRGLLTYTVGTGSNTFVIEAFDNAGADSNDATLTIAGVATNSPPVVTALAGSSYAAGTVLTGTDLFSASDPQGTADIDYIRVFDASLTGGAVWRYNGSVVTPGSAGFQFEYANRGLLTYTVGTGSNTFVIEAFDNAGADSNDATLTIAGVATNSPPVVTALAGSSYAAGTVLTGTDLFSASDPQGSSDIDYIRVFDASLTGGAVWRYNGSVVTPGSAGFQFEYANRGLLTYTVGTGSNTFVIEAFDNAGADSNDATLTIAGVATNSPPVVTALAGSSYAAGTVLTGTDLFSASDPQGTADIDYIRVFDASLTGGAVWRYNGSVVTPGSAGFQFEYANRGLLTYTVGTGSNTFVIEAFDNAGADSNDATLTIAGSGGGIDYSSEITVASLGAINAGLTSPSSSFMQSVLGTPNVAAGTPSSAVQALLVTRDVDPSADTVSVTGIRQAVESLAMVIRNAFEEIPGLAGHLNTAGMLNVRFIAGTTVFSNHSWGAAVDLYFGPTNDDYGDNMIQQGLALLIPYFNQAGWYSGAGYAAVGSTEDSMHFEVSVELLQRWFGSSPIELIVGNGLANTITGTGARDEINGYGGNDILDGAGGSDILIGAGGNDFLRGGQGSDVLQGGTGTDYADYRLSTGIALALDGSLAATGEAAGDTFSGIEIILGSQTAGDRIIGNTASNIFYGMGGRDTLSGGGGSDRLRGGTGVDSLTGGAGTDSFQYNARNEGGDIITDFIAADDRFMFLRAQFNNLAVGFLDAQHFRSGTTNTAADGNDYFIFRTGDKTLWFDQDGNGAAAPIMIADLQAAATMTAGDIYIF